VNMLPEFLEGRLDVLGFVPLESEELGRAIAIVRRVFVDVLVIVAYVQSNLTESVLGCLCATVYGVHCRRL
jgi:hypothetical protein